MNGRCILAWVFVLGMSASAQISISGSIWDGQGGPLLAGQVYHANGSLLVPAGRKLTIAPGAILKFLGEHWLRVEGRLVAAGTPTQPIIFSSQADDSAGGDSNGDGPSQGRAEDWRGLFFTDTADGSELLWVEVRYGGRNGLPGIVLHGADIFLQDSIIRDCSSVALEGEQTNARPSVRRCRFENCYLPVAGFGVEALPGFENNVATGNYAGDYFACAYSRIGEKVVIRRVNVLGPSLVFWGFPAIDPGGELELERGIVLKNKGGNALRVAGRLTAVGTATEPLVFTDINDDDHGGDTRKDGPPSATAPPTYWEGLSFQPGSAGSRLEYALVRHAGSNGHFALDFAGGEAVVGHCRFFDFEDGGLGFHQQPAKPEIHDCEWRSALSFRWVDGLIWDNLERMRDNAALIRGLPERIHVVGRVASDVVIDRRSMIAGCFTCSDLNVIPAGKSLSLGPGVVIKRGNYLRFTTGQGVLNVLGTARDPVVFTSSQDDEFGGDTFHDGPPVGDPAPCIGLTIESAAPARIEHLLLRHAGSMGDPALIVASSQASLKAVRVEKARAGGIRILGQNGPLDCLVVRDCVGTGIDLSADVDPGMLRFATVTGCDLGLDLGGIFAGSVHGAIVRGNVVDILGASAANLFASDGEPALVGVNGNIDADPLFVDPTTGDLRLQATSPCIDAAELALGIQVAADHDEASRVSDHDLDGVLGADMGAHEFHLWDMVVTGEPVLGGNMSFTLIGPPAIGLINVGLLDQTAYVPPYGILLVAAPATLVHRDLVWEGYPHPLVLPTDPALVGTPFGVQMGAAPLGNLQVGGMTSVYRARLGD
ncbi:MAG: hypothetical protein H6807_17595 [Planctomycetes bacterium]|nr:hypothetical protein [Planctomycetota bacterium]